MSKFHWIGNDNYYCSNMVEKVISHFLYLIWNKLNNQIFLVQNIPKFVYYVKNNRKIYSNIRKRIVLCVVGNESITGRGCSPHLVDGMHPCDAVKLSAPQQAVATPTIHVRHCVTCFGDACNSSAHKMPTFILILLISFIGFHRFYTIF